MEEDVRTIFTMLVEIDQHHREFAKQMNTVLEKWKANLPEHKDFPLEQKINLLFASFPLLSLAIRGVNGVATLVEDKNYYCAKVLIASLVENVILFTYVLVSEDHLEDYTCFFFGKLLPKK